MAWIKIRTDLIRDPAVIQLAEIYGWQEHVIVGILVKLWSWADEQVSDGNAAGVTKAFLDRYLGVTGFAENLCKVGWLEANDDGIAFPNWERHMSQTAKKRAVTANRVAKSRAGKCNASSVTKALPDKIREDKIVINPPKAPPSKASKAKRKYDPNAIEWADYPELTGERFRTLWEEWLAEHPKLSHRAGRMQLKKLNAMGAVRAIAALEHSIAGDYQGIFEPSGDRNGKPNMGSVDPTRPRKTDWDAALKRKAEKDQLRLSGGTDRTGDTPSP